MERGMKGLQKEQDDGQVPEEVDDLLDRRHGHQRDLRDVDVLLEVKPHHIGLNKLLLRVGGILDAVPVGLPIILLPRLTVTWSSLPFPQAFMTSTLTV